MAKNKEIKKIRPSEALISLTEYHQRVMLLIQNCKFLIQHNKVDKEMISTLESNVKGVDEFYEV
jgi:hypothetical protein